MTAKRSKQKSGLSRKERMALDDARAEFQAALIEFYGDDNYIEQAAAELQCHIATVYRWLNGDPVPGPVQAWVREKRKNKQTGEAAGVAA